MQNIISGRIPEVKDSSTTEN